MSLELRQLAKKLGIQLRSEAVERRAKALKSMERIGLNQPPPLRIIHHPRHFNKPSACKDGFHQLDTRVLMGIPILYCKKCGSFIYKGAYEGNVTRKEMNAQTQPPYREETLEERTIRIWEKRQENPRR